MIAWVKIGELSNKSPLCSGRQSRTASSIVILSAEGGEVVLYTRDTRKVCVNVKERRPTCWSRGPCDPRGLVCLPGVGHQCSRCSLRPALIRLVNTPFSPRSSPRLVSHHTLSLPPPPLLPLCFPKAPCLCVFKLLTFQEPLCSFFDCEELRSTDTMNRMYYYQQV